MVYSCGSGSFQPTGYWTHDLRICILAWKPYIGKKSLLKKIMSNKEYHGKVSDR